MPGHQSDATLDLATIRAAFGGDRAAAERLAERLSVVPRIVASVDAHHGRRLDEHQLEDLSQDVLVILWKKLERFEGVGTLENWIYRFCVYEYLNRLRRRRPEPMDDAPVPMDEPVDRLDPLDRDFLDAALTELGPPEEQVLRLRHEQGLTFEGVGSALGISSNTAKTRYYRGIQWLRERLRSKLGDER